MLKTFDDFGGVFPADKICELVQGKFYVLNSKPSNHPGEHWVAVYLSEVPEFFDSLGHSPEYYASGFEELLIDHGPMYMYNTRRLQNYGSSACGHFCIYYIISRMKGNCIREIVEKFAQYDMSANDEKVVKFYNKFAKG